MSQSTPKESLYALSFFQGCQHIFKLGVLEKSLKQPNPLAKVTLTHLIHDKE